MEVSSNLRIDNLIHKMVCYGVAQSNPGEEAIMKKRLLMVLAVAFMATLLITGSLVITPAKSVFAAEKKVVKIGAIISKTGFASGSETLIWNGLQLFEGWINKKGGLKIKGVPYEVQFVAEDGQSSADGAVAAATKLVNDDQVKFIIGPVMPFMVVASGSVTEPAKVLRVVLYNCFTPDEYGPKTPYTFVANDTTIDFTTPDMQFLKSRFPKAKNIAVLTPDDGAQTFIEPVFKKKAAEEGLNPLPFVLWPLDATDFTSYVVKALATKPDAIFMINGWPIHMGAMLKAAREMGFTGPMFGCHEDPYDIATVAGPAPSDNFYVHNLQVDSPAMTPMIKEIMKLGQAKFGRQSPTYVWAWEAAYCLSQAIEKAQSLDPTAVKNTWEKMTSINTTYGPGKMGGLKTYGINHNVSYATPVTSLQKGKVVWVEWRKVPLP
jgi:branched-chain amino acid transport system substrate-binding protein